MKQLIYRAKGGLVKSQKIPLNFCIVLLVVLTACGTNTPATPAEVALPSPTSTPMPILQQTPSTEPEPTFVYTLAEKACPMPLPKGAVEGDNILCVSITVPELHGQPGGNSIRLTIAIVKSITPSPQPDPLFLLAGGPGSSALDTFIPLLFAPIGEGFRLDRDVIIVEQRGTRYASPYLYCDEIKVVNLALMGQDVSTDERQARLQEAITTCYERFHREGINLSAYNSVENAADIAAVAHTLGYESYNLYGGSYGTMLAQHLMREYPQGLRSVILDSVAPLRHEPNVLHKAASYDRSMRLLFNQCAADSTCAEAYPNLETRFFETVNKLNTTPAKLDLTDPHTGQVYPLLLTGDKLLQIIRDYLYHTQLLPSFPQMLNNITAGQYTDLITLQSILTFNQNLADGMYKSVVCSELVDFSAHDFVDPGGLYPGISRVMNAMLGELWISACDIWKVEALDEGVKTSVKSDIPTLLLSGEFDPTTPPSMAEIASESMRKTYAFTLPGTAHGALGSGDCATAIMLGFLNDPTSKPDMGCLQEMHSVEFLVPIEQTQAVTLMPFTIAHKGIQGVVPEGWSESQPGLFARGHSALDPTLIIYDTVPNQESSVFVPGLLAFLSLEKFPDENTGTYKSDFVDWELYRIETSANGVPIHPMVALGQSDTSAYVIVLVGTPEESNWLYESVFIPAVEAFEPIE